MVNGDEAIRDQGAHGRGCAILPAVGGRRAQWRALRLNAQHPLFHFRFCPIIAADVRQPAVVKRRVVHAIQAARNVARQRHSDLGAKTRRQVQRVFDGVAPAAAQIQQAQFGVYFFEVGYRRHDAVFQNLDGDHVFNAYAHGMAGKSFSVGHDDFVGRFAKGLP